MKMTFKEVVEHREWLARQKDIVVFKMGALPKGTDPLPLFNELQALNAKIEEVDQAQVDASFMLKK